MAVFDFTNPPENLIEQAIAIKEFPRYISRQCVAAMFSVIASLVLRHYSSRLDMIFTNPRQPIKGMFWLSISMSNRLSNIASL